MPIRGQVLKGFLAMHISVLGVAAVMILGGLIFGEAETRRRIWKGAAWIGGTVTVLTVLVLVLMNNADHQRATELAANCAKPWAQSNLSISDAYGRCSPGSAARGGN